MAITVSLDNHHDDDYTTNDNVMNFPPQVSRASVFSHNPSRPKDTIKTKKVKQYIQNIYKYKTMIAVKQ